MSIDEFKMQIIIKNIAQITTRNSRKNSLSALNNPYGDGLVLKITIGHLTSLLVV